MTTLLFCTAWADTTEALDRRLGRWLRYHAALPWPHAVRLGVAADGLPASVAWPACDEYYLRLNHEPHLGRPSHLAYPGWWRSFTSSVELAQSIGADRIWHVESDFFIASERMIERMDAVRSGWAAFWCPRHYFAETGIQVIMRDRFPALQAIRDRLVSSNYQCFDGQHAEYILPLDALVKDMVGDRYGEAAVDPLTIERLDYYGQWQLTDFEPVFDGRVMVQSESIEAEGR